MPCPIFPTDDPLHALPTIPLVSLSSLPTSQVSFLSLPSTSDRPYRFATVPTVPYITFRIQSDISNPLHSRLTFQDQS
jgi:hypothetical protein